MSTSLTVSRPSRSTTPTAATRSPSRWSTRSSPPWTQIEADEDVGAIVVTGAPPAFCAGADLGNLGGTGDGPGSASIYEGFLRVARSPLPTIAAVNGAAVGAGMNMALGCDVRIAGDAGEVRHPLHADRPPPRRRPHVDAAADRRSAGRGRSRARSARCSTVHAAERVGLAWRCVDDDALARGRARDRRPGGGRATRARDHGEGDARRDGDDRLTRRGRRAASSRRRCGRSSSRRSASGSPRCRPRSADRRPLTRSVADQVHSTSSSSRRFVPLLGR